MSKKSSNQRRFLSSYISPTTGKERLGTGADGQCFHHYVSAENVIKFGLAHPAFPAGQYNIYLWPKGQQATFVCRAYKKAI